MRVLALLIWVTLIVACRSERASSNQNLGGAESASGGAGGASGGASGGGGNSASGAGTGSFGGTSDSRVSCPTSTLPEGAPVIDFEEIGQDWRWTYAPDSNSVEKPVLVERTSIGDTTIGNQSIYLVSSEGERYVISVNSAGVFPTKLRRGSKLWLSAFERADAPIDEGATRRMQFTLRTEQNGPLLLAASQGFVPTGDTWLGVPVSTAPWCSERIPSIDNEDCWTTHEQYALTISSSPVVELTPHTAALMILGTEDYDVALHDAGKFSYSTACDFSDIESDARLEVSVSSRNWNSLIANVSVVESELPTCVLGTDAPPFAAKGEWIIGASIPSSTIESAITPVPSTGDALEFSVPSLGTLSMVGLSTEGRTTLAQAQWISIDTTHLDFANFVIRDNREGKVLAASFYGSAKDVTASIARADRLGLGLSTSIEPRCDWTNVNCKGSGTLQTLYSYDVVYGDTTDHRISSHVNTVVTANGKNYVAWFGITPVCTGEPVVRAAFLANP